MPGFPDFLLVFKYLMCRFSSLTQLPVLKADRDKSQGSDARQLGTCGKRFMSDAES